MTFQKFSFSELELIDNYVFKPCEFKLKKLKEDFESKEYAACTFQLNKSKILFRRGKSTPKKTGQFVTLWKRNGSGITTPLDCSDDFNFHLIATKTAVNFGIFIFPPKILQEKNILSHESQVGKRGFRIYPDWDETTNQQAQKTQSWQAQYFLDLSDPQIINFERARTLFSF